ncbi:L,D-transpeptidase [Flavobacterium sp. 140616W15]|uniref:L,D-transpeptidase n=1 Tax=Flavobacterium sp. 140616W15 TaxID=2478552 RepID=UPI000F0CF560|nr:L,D-transpeptidase [Flavobacterium sp. 140616W15]AYN02938.1 murein L,D-transpeptidase [Flavobacterium sp. 140616W15]
MKKTLLILAIAILSFSCKKNETPEIKEIEIRKKPATISYRIENRKDWLKANTTADAQLDILVAVNRTDKTNFAKMDSILVPSDLKGKIEHYLPFPLTVPYLRAIDKVIFFSYPSQTFAAYEKGQLVYTGPTNMGRKKDPTPTGLFYTNWKAEKTVSTFNDEWDLKWNFNIENKKGVGFHEYALPGYPASHSCLRLQEKDARYLYDWADQWVLADKENVKVKGTPVIVFGTYDFDGKKPWLQLAKDPKALEISPEEIEKETKPFLDKILTEQKNREAYQNNK